MVTCSSQNIYPIPQVAWATDPPSAQEALENSTTKTTEHKGLFTVESMLRILGNVSNYTYFCSVISADKTQIWTASRKNQGAVWFHTNTDFMNRIIYDLNVLKKMCANYFSEDITQEEGYALSIPCIAPHSLQNFSLTWTFDSSNDPIVILRYDHRTRHSFNLWEGEAELDQDLLLLGDGSLVLFKPQSEEHSGTYTCSFSGLQSRHIIQTRVNITVASISEFSFILFLN